MKAKYRRFRIILLFISMIASGVFLILKNFNDNIVFFYSPSELIDKQPSKKIIRIGGMVKPGSIIKTLHTEFIITDMEKEIKIKFNGPLPNLFRENQGIVAKGKLEGDVFWAQELLAKHDENYMPKEIIKTLKSNKCLSCIK